MRWQRSLTPRSHARRRGLRHACSSRGFVVLLDEVYLGIETTPHVSLLHAA